MSPLLDRVLDPRSLTVLFQPVIEVQPASASVDYFEALVRGPRGSTLESPKTLFSYARKHCAEWAMDRTAIAAILREARFLPQATSLGLNVHISTLASDPEFPQFLCEAARESWIDPRRLVLELVEEGPSWDPKPLRESLACLRTIGVRIALDDLGAGRSNLNLVPDCRPEYIKIDRYLVEGSDMDPERRAVLRAVSSLGRSVGSRVVAEGVESRRTLTAVLDLGIDHVQGFLFGQPQPAVSFRAPMRLQEMVLANAS